MNAEMAHQAPSSVVHLLTPHFTTPHFAAPHFANPNFANPTFANPQRGDYIAGPPKSRQVRRGQHMYDVKDSRFFPDITTVSYEGYRLKIKLSMGLYKPEDVKVEVQDNFVVIEAQHEERKEKRCFVSRGFKRRINIPPPARVEDISGKWSRCGWLSIYVPMMDWRSPDEVGVQNRPGDPDDVSNPNKPLQVRTVPITLSDV